MSGMGYRWRYLDVDLDDGRTVVAVVFDRFPFLPGKTDPALQLDVYDAGRRVLSVMAIGPPTWALDGSRLEVDAWAPFPGIAVKGTVEVEGKSASMTQDLAGHRWELLVPRGRGKVSIGAVDGVGTGYADGNEDDRPMTDALRSWVWARVHGPDGTRIAYRVDGRDGAAKGVFVRTDGDGTVVECADADVRMEGPRWPSAFGIPLSRRLRASDWSIELGRPCLTAPFYVRMPTEPRGLAEIGRPRAITWPVVRHLVAMRPTGTGPDPVDGNRVLHKAERAFLGGRRR